jgi:Arc/MetJ-type ribon-helix-helix transcriptional regulator
MSGKVRLSVSIDAEVLKEAERMVKAGAAPNLSVWVNNAMKKQLDSDRRLAAGRALIADYEARHGVITDEEIELAQREARRRALSVRGLRAGESRRKYGR